MKKFLSFIIVIALLIATISTPVLAAEDQFIVGQTIDNSGADVTAPSVPTDLSATAVSQIQINLAWTASADDNAVTGYQVFRDSVFIATSSVTNYSDTGLSPDTTYSYTVTAFDAAENISAQSAPATATTFPAPSSTGPVGNSGTALVLRYLSVSPELRSALIQFGTNFPVQDFVYWGRTPDYELGSLTSALYEKDHSVQILGLTPGTHYFFKIELLDGYGRKLVVENQEFTTLALPDVFPPANVSNLLATPSEKEITLTWKNPKADFDFVRIVKSDKFYPRDPAEGEIIYEGRGEKYVDRDVVRDTTYYYSAFSRDKFGNYSSGAVTDGRLLNPGEEVSAPRLFADVLQLPKELIDSLLKRLSVADIDFIQDGQKLPVVGNTVDIRGDHNLTVSIDYAKVPEILKTIAVTMFDPEDQSKTFSFLLRVNAAKTAYEANIAALERPGKYEFSLAILDHKHQGLALLAGTIVSRVPDLFSAENADRFAGLKIWSMNFLWLLILVFVLLVLMFWISRKNKNLVRNQSPVPGARN